MDELLTITVAKEIHDFENVVLGIGVPTVAGAMAKALYAPHATLMMESGIIDFEPLLPLNHIADAHACRGFSYATDLFSIFTATYRGYVDVCFLGVGQIDKHGNLNTTVIGDYYRPTLRLPGSGGACRDQQRPMIGPHTDMAQSPGSQAQCRAILSEMRVSRTPGISHIAWGR